MAAARKTPRVLSQFFQDLLTERYEWHDSVQKDEHGKPVELHVPVQNVANRQQVSRDGDDDEEENEKSPTKRRKRAIDFQTSLQDHAAAAGVTPNMFARWAIAGAKNGTASGKATLLARLNGHMGEDDAAKRVRLEDAGQTEEAIVSVLEEELPDGMDAFVPGNEEDRDEFERAAFDVAHAVGGCASDDDMNADVDPLEHAQKARREEYNRKAACRMWTTRMEKAYAQLLRLRKQIAARY